MNALVKKSAQVGSSQAVLHLLEQIQKNNIITKPFSHLEIENVFPSTFYESLLRNLPSHKDYRIAPVAYKTNSTFKRYEFRLNNVNFNKLPKQRRLFWLNLHKSLQNKLFPWLLFNKFQDESDQLLKKSQYPKHLICRLVKEIGPYELKPHLDRKNHIFTVVVYLPPTNSFKRYGTTLYRVSGDDFITAAKTTIYKKNSALILHRTDNAWHGGDWLSLNKNFERNSLHMYFCND